MFKMLPIVFALTIVVLCCGPAHAIPPVAHGLSAQSDLQLAYVRRGGVAVGPRGGVAVRGPRGGVAVAGPRGGVAARGPYRVGGRYYGGVWYGHVRRWYGGRWWPYGVGSCWAPSPIGYVWTCG
jgi:hypothetical protein